MVPAEKGLLSSTLHDEIQITNKLHNNTDLFTEIVQRAECQLVENTADVGQ